MSSVNLGEALSMEIRAHDPEIARVTIDAVRSELTVIDSNRDTVADAASLKARCGISYADCFALATARRLQAPQTPT